MPRQDENLQRHTLNLHKGDFDRLGELYPGVGAGVIIRQLVRKQIELGEEKLRKEIPTLQVTI